MIINHNMNSMNANRMLGVNNDTLAKVSEKLSSGYRINRGADDAAGLAISEKMRGQIRGLDQGLRNSQDGISLLQTADGGMNEIHSVLQRCRELADQAANGTYTDGDRSLMQEEVTQLVNEVDRLAYNTEFNGYSLLSGTFNKDGTPGVSDSIVNCVKQITTSGGVTEKYNYNGTDYASASVDFSNLNSAADVAKLVGEGFNYTCCTCDKAYSIKFVSGTPDTSRLNDINPVMEVDVSSITNGTDLVKKIIETAYGQTGFAYDPTINNGGIPNPVTDLPVTATSFVKHYSQLAADGAKLYVYDDRHGMTDTNVYPKWPNSSGSGAFKLNVYGETPQEKDKFFYADIQVGSNEGQKVRIYVQNVTAKELGINNLLVDTQENASSALAKIDNAINVVSKSRATVGAYQNRLEHIVNSTGNTSENLQSAESRIRDADMAKEAMEAAKSSVLEQAAQTMLSQANKMPESILNLMKQWGQG